MIVDSNITTYIHSLDREPDPELEALRECAESSGVPIIRREMESFMKVLLQMKKPGQILEIGAAVGYSAIFMALNTDEECHIMTIENYMPRIEQARWNIEHFGAPAAANGGLPDRTPAAGKRVLKDRITLIEQDAGEVLPALKGPYDIIFLDAAKGQYISYLPDLLRLLPEGGLLLADNVLQDGDLVRSRYATPRRQRTIHDRMREFIWEIKHTDELETSLITIGDGVTLSIRK